MQKRYFPYMERVLGCDGSQLYLKRNTFDKGARCMNFNNKIIDAYSHAFYSEDRYELTQRI